MSVSTSSRSFRRLLINGRRAPDATDAGYIFAKLLSPCIAALRSSSSVALCNLPIKVLIVSVAVCLAGACDSRIRNIATGHSIFHGHHRPGAYQLVYIEPLRGNRLNGEWWVVLWGQLHPSQQVHRQVAARAVGTATREAPSSRNSAGESRLSHSQSLHCPPSLFHVPTACLV